MKVVVTQLGALGGYVSREFYYIITELLEAYGWGQIDTGRLWAGATTVGETLRREFGRLPEVLLFWEGYDFLQQRGDEVQRLDCRKYIFADDLHCWRAEMRAGRLVGFALCEAVLATYAYRWDDFYPEFGGTKRLVWVPHSASPDFLLGYNRRPENAILLSGAVNSFYPMREQLKRLYERRAYAINYQPHPGYQRAYDYGRDGQVGRRYARTIRRHRAAFTDGLIHRYVVAKHFEIPAAGALLVADEAVGGPLRELGFVAHEHYLPASAGNLEEKVRYVLDERNRAEVDEIRRRGRELVRARHTTADRARQIDEACRA